MANKRSLNRVILVGTVGRDPEVTHIPNRDRDVARFSMVTTEVFMDKGTNQFQETPEWHNIVAWGWVAKKVERSVSKGALVLVEGKIQTRKWKDQNDQERRTTQINAETVTVLERPRDSRDSSYGGDAAGSGSGRDYYGQSRDGGGGSGGGGGGYSQPPRQDQGPPEVQIDDLNDMPYDESDPF